MPLAEDSYSTILNMHWTGRKMKGTMQIYNENTNLNGPCRNELTDEVLDYQVIPNTVKPHYNGHLWDPTHWLLYRGNLLTG